MTLVIHYTESILKQAIWDYINRVSLKKLLLPTAIVAFLLIVSLFLDSTSLQVFISTPVLAVPVMVILGYWLRIRQSLKTLAFLDDGKVVITLTESSITIESAIGKSETTWKIYTELWEFQTNYLLLYPNHQFLTLPKNQVAPEFVHFIRRHLNPA